MTSARTGQEDTMNVKTAEIAKTAGIAPRTKHYVLRDKYGLAYEGNRSEHVLAALQRSDKTPTLDFRVRVVAMGLYKSFTTGRMDIHLARRIREQYTPYQLCALVARIANTYQGDPTIGSLADFWINAHAAEL